MPPRPSRLISLYLPRKKALRPASKWPACQKVMNFFAGERFGELSGVGNFLRYFAGLGKLRGSEEIAALEDR